ncbi:hypothetical protein SAMN05518672_103792 [Chitinophaga sp. CF118]|uniref:hypothetical protein n=1 Tax=Chitinophaga sp. CF118 TaxID=1884367 RepID=UPI0008E73EE4|nr:hypothetical protein [Chitinophaga sp. CF118]SFD90578.1 hypothetical protein SAMN05518672_103792 [Chitinophaga sp. CF118]
MSKKSKESVKHEIQVLAIGNYRSYPEDYSTVARETSTNVQSLAKGYWDSREYKEIERDERLGIQLEDYKHWTLEAFQEFMRNNENSMN